MDQKPKIPTLKDTQKPQVRIKGLAARLSLVERLKQFKKKDLAFILAGLGVLFMAPLAEHFMMSPENADTGAFKPGWGFQAKGFGDGTSPYDPGVNGMAPGSQLGGGGDVITPLNVRDPSALVMGPGSSQQPAATSTTPPPPAKENTDWKDAIANAASKGATTATKAASLPVPKTSLTNAGLRGLGVAGGNSGASWNAPPISASNVPNRAGGGSNMAGVTKRPDYLGVGSRGPKNADAGSLEDLKKMAERAGSMANRQGSAGTALGDMAGLGKGDGSGIGGDGAGRGGKEDKGGGGNSGKDSKSLGESLAFLAAKSHQQHAIDLYWKMKEKDAMLWPNLKEKLLEEAVMTPFKALTAGISDSIKNFGADAASGAYWDCGADGSFPVAGTPDCSTKTETAVKCCVKMGASAKCGVRFGNGWESGGTTTCTKKTGDPKDPPSGEGGVSTVQKTDGGASYSGRTLEQICSYLDSAPGVGAVLMAAAQKTVTARDALSQNPSGKCKASSINKSENIGGCVGCVNGLLEDVEKVQLVGAQGVVTRMENVVSAVGGLAGTAKTAIGDNAAGKTKDALDALPENGENYSKATATDKLKYGDVYTAATASAKTAGEAQAKIAEVLAKAKTEHQSAKELLGQAQGLLGQAAAALSAAGIEGQVKAIKEGGGRDAVSVYNDLKKVAEYQKSQAEVMAVREANLGKSIQKAEALVPGITALNSNGNNVANTPNMTFVPDAVSGVQPPAKTMSLPTLKTALETTITKALPEDAVEDKVTKIKDARTGVTENGTAALETLTAVSKQALGDDGSAGLKKKVGEVMNTSVAPGNTPEAAAK